MKRCKDCINFKFDNRKVEKGFCDVAIPKWADGRNYVFATLPADDCGCFLPKEKED